MDIGSYFYSWKQPFKNKKVVIGISVGVLILITAIVVGYFTNWYGFAKKAEEEPKAEEEIDIEKVKVEAPEPEAEPGNILSGLPCDNLTRRPIGVTLSSDSQARPLLGTSEADMVFEVPSTGNSARHTRLLAIYSCNSTEKVRSIRSGRKFHADLMLSMDGMLAHWGYSPEGNTYINNLANQGILNNFNALGLSSPYFTRNYSGVSRKEDTGTANIGKLYEYAESKGWHTETEFEGYSFLAEDEISEAKTGTAGKLTVDYNSSTDKVYYNYDPENNTYKRFWAGIADKDGTTGTQIGASNVVIMQTQIVSQSDPHYANVTTTGTGTAKIYQNGKEIVGTWKRSDREKLYFYDSASEEIKLVPGQTWVEVVEASNTITWAPALAAQP